MFIITKRFGRNETRIGSFATEQQAIAAIMEKLKEDKLFKLMATYGLYEGADLLKEYSEDDIPVSESDQGSADAAGSKKGSSQTFAPTPFNTTPHLGPRSYIKNEEDTNEDDKNQG